MLLLPWQIIFYKVLVGLASSGPHSNGYSLIRKLAKRSGLSWDAPAPFETGRTLGEALLAPTRIYVKPLLAALKAKTGVKALAHITGGGFVENIPRVLPEELAARIDLSKLPVPPVFGWLREQGDVAEAEMLRTFNCGAGMVAVLGADKAEDFMRLMEEHGEKAFALGEIVPREGNAVMFEGHVEFVS